MKKLTQVRQFFTLLVAASTTMLFSCTEKEDVPSGAYSQDAVLITNEGNFNTPNGSVSYYNRSTKTVENNIFQEVNKRLLGDVVQHASIYNDRAYLVVNNSNKIEVVNADTFKEQGTVKGLALPRYFVALNDNKGYVTEWVGYTGNGRVAVINLNTLSVTKTIEVGKLPEQLLIAGGKLYVTNNGGNTISVINTTTDIVESNIAVKNQPNSLVLDRNNNLWVLSGGNKVYNADWTLNEALSEAGALTKINIANNTVLSSLTFGSKAASPSQLVSNGEKDKLFYNYQGKVYAHAISSNSLSNTAFLNRGFYSLGVDPVTGILYGGNAGNFTADGWVVRFTTTGSKIDSFQVGVAPNGFIFR
jgi:YVTN family beta-propeller protein